jgi:cytochrome b subunit of formate dehydrogenase
MAGLCLGLSLGLPGFGAEDANATKSKTAEVFANADCLECHADANQTRKVQGKIVPLPPLQTNRFEQSVHGKLNCVDCHTGIKELVHDSPLPQPQCISCHEAQPTHEAAAKAYAASIHGLSQTMGASAAATCADCHGFPERRDVHYLGRVKGLDSPVFKLNLPRTCAKCHSHPGLTKEYQMKYPQVAAQFTDSIHGRALLQTGLIVAPSCNDCHGVHDIKRSVDRSSPINRANLAKTCGKCHLKVEAVYNQSVHSQLLAKGVKQGPVCTDCHTAHQIEAPSKSHYKQASDQRCGRCHQDRLKYYHDTYHGKAMALGKPNVAAAVAACHDCHGHHDVLSPTMAASRLSTSNIVETCRQCHAGANANFAKYLPHANPLDRKNYPGLHLTFILMTTLLVAVFVFFGSHALLWLSRSAWLYRRDSKEYREAKVRAQQDSEWFTRFAPFDRFLHLLVVTSFLLLVMTGMPLKFYYAEWARILLRFLGGVEVARWLHRLGAVVTFSYFGLHLAHLARLAWRKRGRLQDPATGRFQFKRLWAVLFGPDSMAPSFQDWRDFVAHVKWFLGKGEKPQFDRWTYWEKFDYFAVFWGVFVIGLSGLVMWFPQFFSKFAPGWIINVALIVHSDEALLAAGFIFTIHFFNTHFRLERFPMDTVIFSGRISRAELLHERKRWYERLVAEGRLEAQQVKDEWDRWRSIVRFLGYTFFGSGVFLLLLIIYAIVSRLAH